MAWEGLERVIRQEQGEGKNKITSTRKVAVLRMEATIISY